MKKPLPTLQTDDEVERFVAEANLTEYDLSGLRTVQFEFQRKSERLNLRVQRGYSMLSKLRPQAPAFRISASSDKHSKPRSSARSKRCEPPATPPRRAVPRQRLHRLATLGSRERGRLINVCASFATPVRRASVASQLRKQTIFSLGRQVLSRLCCMDK